jgi:hypothetical protein
MFMSKKKKKKDEYSVAQQNIKILQSGKVKFVKGEKVSLEPFISESLNNAVCSRIEGILSNEKIALSSSSFMVDVTSNLTTMWKMGEMLSKLSDADTQTVVHIVNKKSATEIFNMLDDSIVGTLMRTSTLAAVYDKIENDWKSINEDDKTSFTNVLMIPQLFVFLDDNTGKIRKNPFKINLLLISEPSVKYMKDGIERPTGLEVINRLISDTFEAATKIGNKHLIIAPFCHKAFVDDPYETAKIWGEYSTIDSTLKNIESISYAVNNEDLYIIFMKNLGVINKFMDSSLTK